MRTDAGEAVGTSSPSQLPVARGLGRPGRSPEDARAGAGQPGDADSAPGSCGQRAAFNPPPDQVRAIIAAYEGLSLDELGEKYGRSARTMGRLLRREGVPLRKRGRPGNPLPPSSELEAARSEAGSIRAVARRYPGISERRLREALLDLPHQPSAASSLLD